MKWAIFKLEFKNWKFESDDLQKETSKRKRKPDWTLKLNCLSQTGMEMRLKRRKRRVRRNTSPNKNLRRSISVHTLREVLDSRLTGATLREFKNP